MSVFSNTLPPPSLSLPLNQQLHHTAVHQTTHNLLSLSLYSEAEIYIEERDIKNKNLLSLLYSAVFGNKRKRKHQLPKPPSLFLSFLNFPFCPSWTDSWLSPASDLLVSSRPVIFFFFVFFRFSATAMGCRKMMAGNLEPARKRSGGVRTKQAGRGSCRGS